MANFAILFNGVVHNVVVADDASNAQESCPANAQAIEITGPCGYGWTYDGANFVAPKAAEPTTPAAGA